MQICKEYSEKNECENRKGLQLQPQDGLRPHQLGNGHATLYSSSEIAGRATAVSEIEQRAAQSGQLFMQLWSLLGVCFDRGGIFLGGFEI
jgi:hypothetical protein